MYLTKVLAVALWFCALFCLACQSLSQPPQSKCDTIKQEWGKIKSFDYSWGAIGEKQNAVDCSGAIYYIQKRIGKPVPRTTSRKYSILAAGDPQSWKKAKCGYWIWWTLEPDRLLGHIGMHVEQPWIWQSGSSTGPHRENMAKERFWQEHFVHSKKPGG